MILCYKKNHHKLPRVIITDEIILCHQSIPSYFIYGRYTGREVEHMGLFKKELAFEKIELSKGIIFHYGTLVLKEKGAFGDRILFLASRKRIEIFITENPHLVSWIEEV